MEELEYAMVNGHLADAIAMLENGRGMLTDSALPDLRRSGKQRRHVRGLFAGAQHACEMALENLLAAEKSWLSIRWIHWPPLSASFAACSRRSVTFARPCRQSTVRSRAFKIAIAS
jgi:hypothetical protein